jgi:hypothetical protein
LPEKRKGRSAPGVLTALSLLHGNFRSGRFLSMFRPPRCMGPPFFFFLLNQACKGVALQNGGHFVPHFLPGPVYGAENAPFTASRLDEALIQGQGALFGPDHVEQGNLARVFGQIEAASDPSLGSDDTLFD